MNPPPFGTFPKIHPFWKGKASLTFYCLPPTITFLWGGDWTEVTELEMTLYMCQIITHLGAARGPWPAIQQPGRGAKRCLGGNLLLFSSKFRKKLIVKVFLVKKQARKPRSYASSKLSATPSQGLSVEVQATAHLCYSPLCVFPEIALQKLNEQKYIFTLGDWLVPALIGKMDVKSIWRKI